MCQSGPAFLADVVVTIFDDNVVVDVDSVDLLADAFARHYIRSW